MGFSPRQVDAMRWPEFLACRDAFAEFHGGEAKPDPMTDDEFDDLRRKVLS